AADLYRPGSARVTALGGAHIESVDRRGKAILISLRAHSGKPDRLVVHLGMTGQLEWNAASALREKPKHLHGRIRFSDGSELRYIDPRRFGFIFVGTSKAVDETLQMGPDPFEMEAAELAARLAKRSAPIKSLLLDQHIISGLGNIYVDEALHLVQMHPLTPGSRAARQAAEIIEAARVILMRAIEARGTTLRDYRRTDGSTGEFQIKLSVYGRDGEKCPRCGSVIKRIVVSQRGTHFCPHCQRAPGVSAKKGGTSHAGRSRRAAPRPADYKRSR
ncbi:MAG TPA: bifunctional DNA-formamidopyrimidine glycosylase/DNA-(apurinic or apyrimidinic site) lyase, partial [Candidatus Krumholzibacteria bacterium]|nr:bifunctional DNA-formamidopyrimidine glycosylase/DNA-(apurinic or apyrimidinic site) lyase [Candidatus Krumholzibacteria bacterium]